MAASISSRTARVGARVCCVCAPLARAPLCAYVCAFAHTSPLHPRAIICIIHVEITRARANIFAVTSYLSVPGERYYNVAVIIVTPAYQAGKRAVIGNAD